MPNFLHASKPVTACGAHSMSGCVCGQVVPILESVAALKIGAMPKVAELLTCLHDEADAQCSFLGSLKHSSMQRPWALSAFSLG